MEIEQKQFHKQGMKKWKKGFFRKHEKLMKVIFQEKELIEQKKHERVNIHKKESK